MPKWDPIRLSVAGYQSGKTDFSERIAAFSNEGQQKYESFLAWVASVALTPGAVAFVQVRGYSDRQDAENMTATQRRKSEEDAAAARAESAYQVVRARLSAACGPGFEVDKVQEWPGLLLIRIGMGGTSLIKREPISEDQRQENRRVEIVVFAQGMPPLIAEYAIGPDETRELVIA